MFYFLLSIYFIIFVYLANRNFNFGLSIFLLILPSYLIRFNIFGLPSNLLELTFLAIFLVFFILFSSS